MLIANPMVAAAAVAARAGDTLFSGGGNGPIRRRDDFRRESSAREARPGGMAEGHAHHGPATYLRDLLEEDQHGQAAYSHEKNGMHDKTGELEDVVAIQLTAVLEADIANEASRTQQERRPADPRRPPPLPDTNHPSTLLGLGPGASFDDVRRAYRDLARRYHPDVVAGPDASPSERRGASRDFARVNAAFDILKRGEEEGAGGGARAGAPPYATGDGGGATTTGARRRPPRRPQDRTRRPGVSGRGSHPGVEYVVDARSPGRWRTARGLERRGVDAAPEGFGFISSDEQRREERLTAEQGARSCGTCAPVNRGIRRAMRLPWRFEETDNDNDARLRHTKE